MAIPEDFPDAANRHWQDAEMLYSDSRLATADHLFGVAAECAIKSIMVAQAGTPRLAKRYWTHMPGIWDEFSAYCPPTGSNAYATSLPPNPFASWDIGDRYGAESAFPMTRVETHRNGAKAAMKMLEQARLDGVL